MSSVAILQSFQKDSDKPTERMKRSAAICLERKGELQWIIRNILARRMEATKPLTQEQRAALLRKTAPASRIIRFAGDMQYFRAEVPGVKESGFTRKESAITRRFRVLEGSHLIATR